MQLNSRQREAVEHLDGPLLVLAGAGTGKTSTLTVRVAELLRQGKARPWEILAVTFTNKAATEMRERVAAALGPDGREPEWMGTFHSISARMLRRHAKHAGLRSDFTILDSDDSRRVLREIAQEMDIDRKRWNDRVLAAFMDMWKNRALGPDSVPESEAQRLANGRGAAVYREYCSRLLALNAADFGDLLLHMVHIFQRQPDIADEYRNRFRYVLVDEYQDTNVAQYLWLRLVTGSHGNICCVGDDDQSIYGWRGAQVEHILRFERDFPRARVIRLEQNYRSTAHILGAGSGLISANTGRLGKKLWTAAGNGEKVRVGAFADGRSEAQWTAGEIDQLASGSGNARLSLSQIAILVRASYLMRVLEEQLGWSGIPYQVVGGVRFYERAEIRDAVAYMQAIAQPGAFLAFERIANTPRRGLGPVSIQAIRDEASRTGGLFIPSAEKALSKGAVRGKGAVGLRQLLGQVEAWRKQMEEEIPVRELAKLVLRESGYLEMWESSSSLDAQGRIENLNEFINALEEFETLDAFFEHVALVRGEETSPDEESVKIMTIHAAKGLEFDSVFLPAWEEEVIPTPRSLDRPLLGGIEEERRLAHVAITRAKKRLAITWVQTRHRFGMIEPRTPSRFLRDLPSEHISILGDAVAPEVEFSGAGSLLEMRASRAEAYLSPGWRRMQQNRTLATSGIANRHEVRAHSKFAPGVRVFHQKFGYGQVLRTDGSSVDVAFETGNKTIMSSFLAADNRE